MHARREKHEAATFLATPVAAMDPDVIELAQVLAIVGTFSLVMIGAIVVGMKLLKRPPRERPPLDDTRLEHLEQAVDAIAIEIERVSEGQRYMTRLLTEGATPALPVAQKAAEPVRLPDREALRASRGSA